LNGFEKRASRIREKIMIATLDLLRTAGPKRIRIADIAGAADVSQVTIYNYFGSKEALFREVFKDYVDRSVRDFEIYMGEGHSLRETIEHIFRLAREAYRRFPPRLIQELIAEDPELARYIEEQYREKTLPLTVRLIREGKEKGEIPEDVPTESILVLIQMYMNQYEKVLEMAERSGDPETLLTGLARIFFYGICGRP